MPVMLCLHAICHVNSRDLKWKKKSLSYFQGVIKQKRHTSQKLELHLTQGITSIYHLIKHTEVSENYSADFNEQGLKYRMQKIQFLNGF